MMTRGKLLAFLGFAALGLALAVMAITIHQAPGADPKARVDQPRLETVTLTIRGMI